MQIARPVGRGAQARKYDILTALGAHALALGKADQRRILRLMTLVTARYNWNRDELAVGQREIAALWSCDERTVKREMARLRGLGWLVVRRQGARGRVTEYRMDIDQMLADTQDAWRKVGPDFALRMDPPATETSVVPFPASHGNIAPPSVSEGHEWALAQAILHQQDAGLWAAWLQPLTRAGRAGGRVTLHAPSRFHAAYVQTHLAHRLLDVCRSIDDDVSDITIISR